MVTVGLDLHKRYITACALDVAGTGLAASRRLDASLEALGRWLDALPQPLTIALEATLYWHRLERQLTALGHRVVVAPPCQVKRIWQARAKTDPIDARKRAERARVNLLPAIWIPGGDSRALSAAGPRPRASSSANKASATIDGGRLWQYITTQLQKLSVMHTADRLDLTFAALADPTRRPILARVAAGEASVQELGEPCEMSQPAISKHRKVLERAGLISVNIDAQRRARRLAPKRLDEAVD